MKQQFLKIAGVKNEKQFYAKYPTEAAFFKAHPEAKKQLKKAKVGTFIGGEQDPGTDLKPLKQFYDEKDFLVTGKTDEMRKREAYDQAMLEAQNKKGGGGNMLQQLMQGMGGGDPSGKVGGNSMGITAGSMGGGDIASLAALGKNGKKLKKAKEGSSLLTDLGKGVPVVGNIVKGIDMLAQQKKQRKSAEQAEAVSNLTLQASQIRPEIPERRYVRPDIVSPNQTFLPGGTGTNILAKNGIGIGGNLTEIQNTYAPMDIYQNLGYEPLEESDQVKQYYSGGHLRKAQSGFSTFMNDKGGGDIASSLTQGIAGEEHGGGAAIGAGIGEVAGYAFGAPGVGKAIGTVAGTLADVAFNKNARKLKRAKVNTKQNIETAALQSGMQNVNSQYSTYVKEGGTIPYAEYGWMSHDWQPQVIAQFGEHSMKDLLKPDGTMDTLRMGGSIRQNNINPEEQFAFGGELKTHWGGYTEPISYNPFQGGTGETIMFKGNSHEESDGKGRTGIGVSYGDTGNDALTDYAEFGTNKATDKAHVEVEEQEPAAVIGNDMVVFGNLEIPKSMNSLIGDNEAKGKFKHYVKNLAKKESKANKATEKASEKLNNLEVNTPFDKLAFNSYKAMIDGNTQKLKQYAEYKENAASLQEAINSEAAERGIDADALAKGKIKIDKKTMKEARYGKKIIKAQTGTTSGQNPIQNIQDALGLDPQTPGYGKKIGPKTLEAFKKWFKDYWEKTGTTLKTTDFLTVDDIFKDGKIQLTSPYMDALGLTSSGLIKSEKPLVLQSSQNPQIGPINSKDIVNVNEFAHVPSQSEIEGDYIMTPLSPAVSKEQLANLFKGVKQQQERRSIDGGLKTSRYEPSGTTYSPEETTSEKGTGFDMNNAEGLIKSAASQLLPYLNRPYSEDLDYLQTLGEQYALSTNQLQPVQAQQFVPMLSQVSNLSYQDQLNENQATFRALLPQLRNNPEALSQLAAQKYQADSKVLGEQLRINQGRQDQTFAANIATLNDARLKNLSILDQQYQRQSEAESKTKATAQAALNSIAAKTLQNKADMRELAAYSNMFPQYGIGRDMRITNRGLTFFPTPTVGGGESDLVPVYDTDGKTIKGYVSKNQAKETTTPKKKYNGGLTKKHFKNSNIVKSLKNI